MQTDNERFASIVADDARMFGQDVFDISCTKNLGSLLVALLEVSVGTYEQ